MQCLCLFLLFRMCGATSYWNNEYEDELIINKPPILERIDENFEPQVITKNDIPIYTNNINCETFSKYALNCTQTSIELYNVTRKLPPLPTRLPSWCSALKQLTNCATEWNIECKDVTEQRFNEESIRGHIFIMRSICENEQFLLTYQHLDNCISASADVWEACYYQFRALVDKEKNRTNDWTHYEVHFQLCCARAQFRKCTFDALIKASPPCTAEQLIILQKFTVIISEGDVNQDCYRNVMYQNCPGGDPRPNRDYLRKLIRSERLHKPMKTSNGFRIRSAVIKVLICWFFKETFM